MGGFVRSPRSPIDLPNGKMAYVCGSLDNGV